MGLLGDMMGMGGMGMMGLTQQPSGGMMDPDTPTGRVMRLIKPFYNNIKIGFGSGPMAMSIGGGGQDQDLRDLVMGVLKRHQKPEEAPRNVRIVTPTYPSLPTPGYRM